jgi:hypothetical protein
LRASIGLPAAGAVVGAVRLALVAHHRLASHTAPPLAQVRGPRSSRSPHPASRRMDFGAARNQVLIERVERFQM